jgi:hypothetical protein
VIVTVIAMRMMQPAVHEVIDVVTMRYRFVSAMWGMLVCAAGFRRAVHGICGVDRDDMFVDVILMHMVEMAVVKIIHMAVMANRGVPTVLAMLMGVVGMMLLGARGHDFPSFIYNPTGPSVIPSLRQVPSRFAPLAERGCPRSAVNRRRKLALTQI